MKHSHSTTLISSLKLLRIPATLFAATLLLFLSSGPTYNAPHLTVEEVAGTPGKINVVPNFHGGWSLTFTPEEQPLWVVNVDTGLPELFQGPYMYKITAGKGTHEVTFKGLPWSPANPTTASPSTPRKAPLSSQNTTPYEENSGSAGTQSEQTNNGILMERLSGGKTQYTAILPDEITDPNTPVPRIKVEQLLPPGYAEITQSSAMVSPLPAAIFPPPNALFATSTNFSIANACPTMFFLSTRGSGQNDNNTGYGERLGDRGLRVVNEVREKLQTGYSTITSYGTAYPAKHVRNIEGLTGYEASKNHGVKQLTRTLEELASVCSTSRFILFGYSQGADVTATVWESLREELKNKVEKVVLFADPRHNPASTSNKGEGNLGGILSPRTPLNDSKVESWCAVDDYVCSNTESRTAKIAIEQHLHGEKYYEWEKEVARNLYTHLTSPTH